MSVIIPERAAADAAIDCYPRLPRKPESSWTQSARERDRIYATIEKYCNVERLRARVTRSNAEIFPTWVQFEAWFSGGARRVSVLVEIEPKPFHRTPIEYCLTITEPQFKTRIFRTSELRDTALEALLSAIESGMDLVKPPSRLRMRWFEFWRPHNKLRALRPDVLGLTARASLALGAVMAVVSPLGAVLFTFWMMLRDLVTYRLLYLLLGPLLNSDVLATAVFLVLAFACVRLYRWRRMLAWLTAAYGILVQPAGLVLDLAATLYDECCGIDITGTGGDVLSSSEGQTAVAISIGLMAIGGLWLIHERRRPRFVLTDGKPMVEPRTLRLSDYWHVVVPGLAAEAEALQQRFIAAFAAAPHAQVECHREQLSTIGPDGKEEREQVVVGFRRALVFCQFYAYGSDLYVGWDAYLNAGQWVERQVAIGVERQTGRRVRVNHVVPGIQRLSEYDVNDLNCVIEWTHGKLTDLVKQVMAERRIDQEIDFKIQRGARDGLTKGTDEASPKKPRRLLLNRTA